MGKPPMRCILDTNVWIDGVVGCLPEEKFVKVSLDTNWTGYSAITRLELFGFPDISKEEEQKLTELLSNFTEIPVSKDIIDEAILLRKANNIKAPDAIIAATAKITGSILVTRNITDFKKIRDFDILNPHEQF